MRLYGAYRRLDYNQHVIPQILSRKTKLRTYVAQYFIKFEWVRKVIQLPEKCRQVLLLKLLCRHVLKTAKVSPSSLYQGQKSLSEIRILCDEFLISFLIRAG